jgi:hypothetical protein
VKAPRSAQPWPALYGGATAGLLEVVAGVDQPARAQVYVRVLRFRPLRVRVVELLVLSTLLLSTRPGQHLESYAADVFGRLAAAERLRGLARDPYITGLVGFLAHVNALHPFREDNGRVQRASFAQLAHDAGHHIAWVRMDLTATRPPAPPPTTVTWPAPGNARPADRPAAPLRAARPGQRTGQRTGGLTSRRAAAALGSGSRAV